MLQLSVSQRLTPRLLAHTYFFCANFPGAFWQLQEPIQYIIVRNWGDETVVDHVHHGYWFGTIRSCLAFRETFDEAKKQPLLKSRENKLSLAKYLIH